MSREDVEKMADEAVRLYGAGMSTTAIATALHRAPQTISYHLERIRS